MRTTTSEPSTTGSTSRSSTVTSSLTSGWDADQELLVVHYAHCDLIKHSFPGVAFDPNFLESVRRCCADRGLHLPLPFFRETVPV